MTWRTDPGRRQPNIWFSSPKLDATELPVVALPFVEPTPAPTALPTEQLTAEPTIEPTRSPTAIAAETPQTSAAVSAVMGKAKLTGLDKQLVEVSGNLSVTLSNSQRAALDKALDNEY